MREAIASTNLSSVKNALGEADMSELTISIAEEKLARLREKDSACGVSAEELVSAGIDRLLEGPDEDFERAAAYMLNKNEELYRRLA
jgi:hypothetical protein